MTKLPTVALLATIAALAVAPSAAMAGETNQQVQAAADTTAAGATAVTATAGKMLYGPDGRRIGSIYRVAANGNVELILDGKLVRVAASTLSEVNGKITTSQTKKELIRR